MKSFRRLAKNAGANLLHTLSLDKTIGASRGMADDPLIICYHRVVENFSEAATRSMPSLLVSCRMFEQQLDWFSRHFDMVSLDEIRLADVPPTRRTKKRRAAITFDDGYADFYWNAFPILESRKIPSAVFVVTDLVGTSTLQTHDELYLILSHALQELQQPSSAKASAQEPAPESTPQSALLFRLAHVLSGHKDVLLATRAVLAQFSSADIQQLLPALRDTVAIPTTTHEELRALDWPMLRTLAAKGVCIGSHTKTHALLPHHDDLTQQTELAGSRLRLEKELGKPATHLAYPDGQFDERTAEAVGTAGYTHAYTICPHQSVEHPQYTLSRRVLWEHACSDQEGSFSPAMLSCLVNGVFDYNIRCTHDHRAL